MSRAGAWSILGATAALGACKIGGPSADPSAYVTFPSDAGVADASMEATAEPPPPGDDATTDQATPDAPDDDTNATDAPDDRPVTEADARACGGSFPVCDPVHDTGCNPFQQCDVDPTQTTTPTGVCVFNSAQPDGAACVITSLLSESCPPKSTCVGSACRALCACDADCPAGQCCSDTRGPAGFILCQACP